MSIPTMMGTNLSNFIHKFWFDSTAAVKLANYRIFFGILVLFSTIRFIANGWVESLYITPKLSFHYYGFEWVNRLPGNWMYLPFVVLIIACLGVIFGLFYRFSAVLLFISFTYIELLDKTNYLNHYYFVSLVAFILIFLPANKAYSLDVKWRGLKGSSIIPKWTVFILQFQIGVVYFFAGIAKIHPDWLFKAEPLVNWLKHATDFPVLGPLFEYPETAFVFAWAGMLFDLSVPFFLAWRKSRPFAYIAVVVFHVLTWKLFNIGVFPWVMIVSTTIFFSNEFHQKLWPKRWRMKDGEKTQSAEIRSSKFITVALGIYLFIQLALPLRTYFYSGNRFWHEEGFRFGWRVMLKRNGGHATFYVVDRNTGKSIEIVNSDYLTPNQERYLSFTPDMILEFGHYLYQEFNDTTIRVGDIALKLQDPKIECEAYASLNGSERKLFVSRKHDLSRMKNSFKRPEWIESY